MPDKRVSIHAPARGATKAMHLTALANSFNPRTRTGCDLLVCLYPSCCICFNPRTRTGCDVNTCTPPIWFSMFQSTHPHGVRLTLRAARLSTSLVSIHAPARGATSVLYPLLLSSQCFNPRTRTGCDSKTTAKAATLQGFNPRTRTGCDLGRRKIIPAVNGFNPRTRTGCDIAFL